MRYRSRQIWSTGDRVTRRCETQLGGKAMGLFRLVKQKLAVPPFRVISTAVFETAIRSHRQAIDDLLSGVEWERRDSIESASACIQAWILGARLPCAMERRIQEALIAGFEASTLFAVRSSVVGEDSREHSFAGQMESFLNVRREDVTDAVKKVWASAFSPRALLYRAERGLSFCGISSAVIVQRMVASDSSGVVFSRDPQMQGKICVITAGYGLGEGVVKDLVETDTYRVDWDTTIIQKAVGSNKRRTGTSGSGEICVNEVAEDLRAKPVLDDGRIREVAAAAKQLEQELGTPQDVEWAYSAGKLFILQTRPIVRSGASETCDWRIWDNSNIVESYPGLTLPLTFSFVRQCYAVSFRRAVEGFLLRRREIRDDLHIFDEMIGLLDGRVYYNLLNWYRMMSYLPGYRRYKKSWDDMIGITRAVPFPERHLSPLNRVWVACAVLYRLLTVERSARRFFRHFQPAYRRYQGLDFARFGSAELVSTFRGMQRDFSERWHLTLYNDFCAIKYYDWLRELCGRWGLERFPNLHNDLLCGEAGVESVRPIDSLLSICALIRQEPRFTRLFSESSEVDIWQRIQSRREFSPLKVALERHLEAFGDRGMEELKLEKSTYRDRPEEVVGLLKSYIGRGTSRAEMEQSEGRLRSAAEAKVKETLRHPLKRALFRFILRNARRAVAHRENMRFARSRLFGIARRLFRRLADQFVDQGALDGRDDFYYLTLPEVFGYLQGTAATQDLRRLVELRRAEYAQFQARTAQERLQTTGAPYPVPAASDASDPEGDGSLWGTGCSSGTVRGDAWVVSDPHAADRAGDYVLVAESTDPGWVFLMIRARGMVVERGSVLSHTAIIGRELGIPTVVGVRAATTRIEDRHAIWLNGSTGEVRCA